jgi:hypothetical protein
MKRFPSSHGARVVFDPVRSAPPAPGTRPARRSGPVPRAAGVPRELVRPPVNDGPVKPRSPSYAEVDVVEADLAEDPRYEGGDDKR